MHAYLGMRVYVLVCVRAYVHMYGRVCKRAYVHACMHSCVRAFVCLRMCVRVRACVLHTRTLCVRIRAAAIADAAFVVHFLHIFGQHFMSVAV